MANLRSSTSGPPTGVVRVAMLHVIGTHEACHFPVFHAEFDAVAHGGVARAGPTPLPQLVHALDHVRVG